MPDEDTLTLGQADRPRADFAAISDDLDIWRAANLLIRKHGANAELEAAKRADLMLDRNDDDGRLLWMRIRRAIKALQAPTSDTLN